MMHGLPLIALVLAQNPKTFQDLELAKVVAFHNLTALHFEVETEVATTQGPATLRTSLFRDGKRSHMIFLAPGGQRIESVDDGTKSWFIVHGDKKYWESTDLPEDAFSPEKNVLKAGSGSFSMNLTGMSPMQFASDPPLQIQTMGTVEEFGGKFRKVVAGAIGHLGHHLTVTQWFLPDRWLVKMAEIATDSNDGPVKTQARVTIMDLHPVFRAGEFALDPRLVLGYEKNAGPAPKGIGG